VLLAILGAVLLMACVAVLTRLVSQGYPGSAAGGVPGRREHIPSDVPAPLSQLGERIRSVQRFSSMRSSIAGEMAFRRLAVPSRNRSQPGALLGMARSCESPVPGPVWYLSGPDGTVESARPPERRNQGSGGPLITHRRSQAERSIP
jgi:hypothetical protein